MGLERPESSREAYRLGQWSRSPSLRTEKASNRFPRERDRSGRLQATSLPSDNQSCSTISSGHRSGCCRQGSAAVTDQTAKFDINATWNGHQHSPRNSYKLHCSRCLWGDCVSLPISGVHGHGAEWWSAAAGMDAKAAPAGLARTPTLGVAKSRRRLAGVCTKGYWVIRSVRRKKTLVTRPPL